LDAESLLVHSQEQEDRGLADGREGRVEHMRDLGRHAVAPAADKPGELDEERRA
jgi:hypothetical protein